MKNFYKVLEIKENATKEEIKEAFRRLSKKTHPDNINNNQDLSAQFQEINEANQVLSNPHRKLEYDSGRKRRKKEKWQQLAKAALLLVLVALAAYLLMDNLDNPQKQLAEEIQVMIPPDITEGNTEVTPSKEDDKVIQPKSPIYKGPVVKKAAVLKQNVEVAHRSIQKPKTTSNSIAAVAAITPEKRNNQHTLSEVEMKEMLNSIDVEKTKNNNIANCIKIRKTTSSNIENWQMVPTFLREKGFIISGREVVNKDIEGIRIEVGGECLILTIGFFSGK